MVSALSCFTPQLGYAADVTPNGQTATKVVSSSNGATVIQIAPTTTDGTSYNGFSLFNASNAKGTVFNNSTQATTSSAWGTIKGNTALNGNSATQIIAEVNVAQSKV